MTTATTTSVKNMLDVKGGAVIGSGYAGVSTAASDGLSVQGNVGIGIAIPTAKLDVVGNFKVSGLSYLTGNAYLSSNLYLDGGFGAYLKSTAVGSHVGQSIQIYADNSVLSATFAPTGVTVPGKLTVSGITTQTGRVNVNGASDAVNYWMNVKNGKIATSGGNPIYSFGVGDPASQVAGDPNYSAVYLVHTGTNAVLNSDGGGVPSAAAKPLLLQTKGITAVSIGTDQRVGIGTTSPGVQLDVTGSHVAGQGIIRANSSSHAMVVANSFSDNYQSGFRLTSAGALKWDIAQNENTSGNNLSFSSAAKPQCMVISQTTGNIGIGGAPSSSYKLDVNGTANISGALTVASVNTKVWSIAPDYVFEKDYDLKPLAHVDQYVRENKHLPEIPSAKEISEKGIDLAEMNMKLLRKVEELTLYAISQQKENGVQGKEIAELRESVRSLRQAVSNAR